jgi:two-component system, sensor histidine kinase and response regulator
VCLKLDKLLADDDAQALDLLHEHADLLSSAFPDHYPKISDAIRSFDFEVALLTLRQVHSS